jgi:exodeoxyribonuclease VII large subunit
LERRHWKGEVFLLPSLVQGPKAPENLVNSVKQSRKIRPKVDLIVLTRGGGSVEDLWAFNDEALVREIADSKIPFISAIGHETDFVLCDFAADLRAETPSGAAELISSNYLSQIEKFSFLKDRLMDTKSLYLQSIRDQYELLSAKLKLFSPINKIERQSQQIDDLEIRLRHSAERIFEKKSERIHYLAKSLEASNLQRTLEKGFTIVRNQKGKIIKDGGGLAKNDKVLTTFRDGEREMSVE